MANTLKIVTFRRASFAFLTIPLWSFLRASLALLSSFIKDWSGLWALAFTFNQRIVASFAAFFGSGVPESSEFANSAFICIVVPFGFTVDASFIVCQVRLIFRAYALVSFSIKCEAVRTSKTSFIFCTPRVRSRASDTLSFVIGLKVSLADTLASSLIPRFVVFALQTSLVFSKPFCFTSHTSCVALH